MGTGRAPVGIDGKPVNLHHVTQTQSGPIAEMMQSFHQSNSAVIHINLVQFFPGLIELLSISGRYNTGSSDLLILGNEYESVHGTANQKIGFIAS